MILLLALLAVLHAPPAAAAEPPEPRVFIGGVGPHLGDLADPAIVRTLRATGRIGLYQHANGMDGLSPERRGQVWGAWGVDAFGLGATTEGEVGSPGPGFMAYVAGHVPARVNANEPAAGRSRYTATSGDAHPGRQYGNYTSAADLVELKAHVDYYRTHGGDSVGVVVSPNQADPDLDDPFATGAFWASVRAIAAYGGAIVLDPPPSYAFARGPAYLSNAAQMIAWGNAHGLRTAVIVSPWALAPDGAGHSGNCGFDRDLAANTRRLVAFLTERNALPREWVVENYCLGGTTNDVDPAGGPESLNAVALFLAGLPPRQ